MRPRRFAFSSLLFVLVALGGCGSGESPESGSTATDDGSGSGGSGPSSTGSTPSTSTSAGATTAGSDSSAGGTTAALDDTTSAGESSTGEAPVDPCTATPGTLCEDFDAYGETSLADGQLFGPWRAALSASGATMDLDGTHTTSGDRALHVRLEQGETSGGRLFTTGDVPLLAESPTHVYGRMMMYIEENGTSVHWTFFGVQGPAEPASPLAGNYAAYIMSSLPSGGVNTYSFVDGLSGGPDYQDCSTQGSAPMPTGEWTCVSFEMDSLERRLRMYMNDDPTPIVSVDDHGNACVPPLPSDSTWWGPEIDELFVGTWSFHPMNDPLEVWIDDLVVDTVPVACP